MDRIFLLLLITFWHLWKIISHSKVFSLIWWPQRFFCFTFSLCVCVCETLSYWWLLSFCRCNWGAQIEQDLCRPTSGYGVSTNVNNVNFLKMFLVFCSWTVQRNCANNKEPYEDLFYCSHIKKNLHIQMQTKLYSVWQSLSSEP